MLQVVENLDVYVVCRAVEGKEFAQSPVVIVFVGEFEDRLASHFAEPYDGATDKLVGPLAGSNLPGMADAGKVFCAAEVGDEFNVRMALQQRSGNCGGCVLLYGAVDNACTVLAPCHCEYAACREDVGYAEGNGAFGCLVAFVVLADKMACFVAEVYQTGVACGGAAGFVESNVAGGADFAQSYVDAASIGNTAFVVVAHIGHCLLGDIGIERAYVLGFDVNVVQEYIFQTLQCGGAFRFQGEEFAYVENDNVGKVHMSFFVHFDEARIHAVGAVACTEGQYAFAFGINIPVDVFGKLCCHKIGAFVCCFKDAGVNFFLAAYCRKLDFRIGIVVFLRNSVKLDLRA